MTLTSSGRSCYTTLYKYSLLIGDAIQLIEGTLGDVIPYQNNHGSLEPFAHGPQSVSREMIATATYSGSIVSVSVAAISGDKLSEDVRLGNY